MKNRTVLFVDDDQITLRALEQTMQDEAYRLLFALSGSQALDIMAQEPVDVVVTDLTMPEMDGMTLLDWAQAEYPDTIRMVLSSQSDTDSILEAINNGSVYRYVVKPWNREELKIAVRQALELFEIQQEKKRLVDKLSSNTLLLEQRLARRSKQLLEIDGLAEIGKHVSQVVHNLNNPLQTIFGNLDLVLLKLSQEDPDLDKIIHSLGRVKNGAMDLKMIIQAIQLHGRTDAIYDAGEVDLNAIVRSELEFFNVNPGFKREIEKVVDLAEPAPIAFGNPVQIKQIVDHLITNAIDAMEGCDSKRLSVTTRVANEQVELTIADTGTGIDDSDISKIFLPDFSTKPSDRGTGLGLASVKTAVEAHDGSISVNSQKDQGTTFTIQLPAA